MFGDDDVNSFLQKSRVMVFQPTLEEFRDFSKYVEHMEECGAAEWGIAKIIPPAGWQACKDLVSKLEDCNITIPHPIIQEISSTHAGIYQQMNIERPELNLGEYEELATSKKYRRPDGPIDFIEQRYWRGLTFNPPIYGADVEGSLYDDDVEEWSIPQLGDVLERVCDQLQVKIPGVNSPYLYFGMWKTTFPWHVEDMDLYSINYLHFGEPKFWYAIPQCHAGRFESMIRGIYPDFFKVCPEFMRHKMTIVSPRNLATNGIPVNRMIQREGEFMITFPRGYHSGFNLGYNAAESVNFALHRWVDLAKKSKFCVCFGDTVSINMDHFIDEYNDLYDMNVEKVIKKVPKRPAVASTDEILKKMRPRRRLPDHRKRLTDYKSNCNRIAILRRTRHRQRMLYKARKLKRKCGRTLLKKSCLRACVRKMFIDPLPELKHEIILESESEEGDDGRQLRSHAVSGCANFIKIIPDDLSPHAASFPHKSWYFHALARIEKDFTLRAENVRLRSTYVREKRISSAGEISATSPNSSSKIDSESFRTSSGESASQTLDADLVEVVETKEEEVEVVESLTTLKRELEKSGMEDNSHSPPTKKKKRKKVLGIDLDVPNSFLANESPSQSSNCSLNMADLFNDIGTSSPDKKEDSPKPNKRKTRKNKGGRPCLQDTKSMLFDGRFETEEFESSILWQPTETLKVPKAVTLSQEDLYQFTIDTTDEHNPVYNQFNTDHVESVETNFKDRQLCRILAKYERNTRRTEIFFSGKIRSHGKPTFGTRGPTLCQTKIQAIHKEHLVPQSKAKVKELKRITVKLKDLIIINRKLTSTKEKTGKVVLKKVHAFKDCMNKLAWVFDHNYTTANTSIGPGNVVAVPVGSGRYRVINVDATCCKTFTESGAKFIQKQAKWSHSLLSQGHNIMGIFILESYMGMSFRFDELNGFAGEQALVRNVSYDLCQKILRQKKCLARAPEQRAKSTDNSTRNDDITYNRHRKKIKRAKPPKAVNNANFKASQYSDSTFKSAPIDLGNDPVDNRRGGKKSNSSPVQLKIKSVESFKCSPSPSAQYTDRFNYTDWLHSMNFPDTTRQKNDQFSFEERPKEPVPSTISRYTMYRAPPKNAREQRPLHSDGKQGKLRLGQGWCETVGSSFNKTSYVYRPPPKQSVLQDNRVDTTSVDLECSQETAMKESNIHRNAVLLDQEAYIYMQKQMETKCNESKPQNKDSQSFSNLVASSAFNGKQYLSSHAMSSSGNSSTFESRPVIHPPSIHPFSSSIQPVSSSIHAHSSSFHPPSSSAHSSSSFHIPFPSTQSPSSCFHSPSSTIHWTSTSISHPGAVTNTQYAPPVAYVSTEPNYEPTDSAYHAPSIHAPANAFKPHDNAHDTYNAPSVYAPAQAVKPSDNTALDEEQIQWCLKTRNVDPFRVWSVDETACLTGVQPSPRKMGTALSPNVNVVYSRGVSAIEGRSSLISDGHDIRGILRQEKCRKERESKLQRQPASNQYPVSSHHSQSSYQFVPARNSAVMVEKVDEDELKELVIIQNPPSSSDPRLGLNVSNPTHSTHTNTSLQHLNNTPFSSETSSATAVPSNVLDQASINRLNKMLEKYKRRPENNLIPIPTNQNLEYYKNMMIQSNHYNLSNS